MSSRPLSSFSYVTSSDLSRSNRLRKNVIPTHAWVVIALHFLGFTKWTRWSIRRITIELFEKRTSTFSHDRVLLFSIWFSPYLFFLDIRVTCDKQGEKHWFANSRIVDCRNDTRGANVASIKFIVRLQIIDIFGYDFCYYITSSVSKRSKLFQFFDNMSFLSRLSLAHMLNVAQHFSL